jgi:hypothetical protein
MLYYNQGVPENFTLTATVGEGIHAEIAPDNGGFVAPQNCGGLNCPICDTI